MHTRTTYRLSIGLAAAIFILDLFLPLGVAVGSLYMFCVLLVNKSNPSFIIKFALTICFLILLKLAIFMNKDTVWLVYANRSISVFAVLSATIYSVKFSNSSKLNEKELNRFSEKVQNFNHIIENMIEGAQIISYDWTYLYINKALERQIHQSKEKLLGKKMFEVYPGIEKTHLFKQLEKVMKYRKEMVLYNEFKFPDGHIDFFELIVQPIPEGLFIMSLIINDRVKIEQERKKYVKELEKMMFYTSHIVRQPVTNIIGLADQLDLHEKLSIDEIKLINYMKKSATDLDVFTHELNNFILNNIEKNIERFIYDDLDAAESDSLLQPEQSKSTDA